MNQIQIPQTGREEAGQPVVVQVEMLQVGQSSHPGREGARQPVAAQPQLLQAGQRRPRRRHRTLQPVVGQVHVHQAGGPLQAGQTPGEIVVGKVQSFQVGQAAHPSGNGP